MKVPNLTEILALRPEAAEADAMRAAITQAGAQLVTIRQRLAEVADKQRGPALSISDKDLEVARREVEALQLAERRLAELITGMQADLRGLEARETHAALQAEAREVADALAALADWQAGEFEELRAMMGRGFRLQDAATAAHLRFSERLREAFRDPDIRACGPLGVSVPALPGLSTMPRAFFPNWGTAA